MKKISKEANGRSSCDVHDMQGWFWHGSGLHPILILYDHFSTRRAEFLQSGKLFYLSYKINFSTTVQMVPALRWLDLGFFDFMICESSTH